MTNIQGKRVGLGRGDVGANKGGSNYRASPALSSIGCWCQLLARGTFPIVASDPSHIAQKIQAARKIPISLRLPPAPATVQLQKIVAFSHVQLGCAASCLTLGDRHNATPDQSSGRQNLQNGVIYGEIIRTRVEISCTGTTAGITNVKSM